MSEATVSVRTATAAELKELVKAPRFFIVFEDKKMQPIPFSKRDVAEVELAQLEVAADLIQSADRKTPAGLILASSIPGKKPVKDLLKQAQKRAAKADPKERIERVKKIAGKSEKAAKERIERVKKIAGKSEKAAKEPTAKKEAAAPKAAKEPTAKKEAAAPKAADTRKITLLVTENPKRGKSVERYEYYRTAKTVAEYIQMGGGRADIAWDAAHNYIKVD
jgi:chemotaxis protein histidine kinase CheA